MGRWTAPGRDLSLRDASPMLVGQPPASGRGAGVGPAPAAGSASVRRVPTRWETTAWARRSLAKHCVWRWAASRVRESWTLDWFHRGARLVLPEGALMGRWTAPARDLSLRDASPMLAGQPRPTDAGSDRRRRRGKF